MNRESVLLQINKAVETILEITSKLDEVDLHKRPTANKYSVGELLEHIASICAADWLISNEATQEEMEDFYAGVSYKTIDDLQNGLVENFESLKNNYEKLTVEELLTERTSYWGVTYTRYEWLLEILSHLYHHRGQLHAILVHCYQKDPGVPMFE
ncbi:DinB family protein [Sediminibacillus massiliensis]|uniref:DinB family protein n=1 Tax=Sediminibacillus massiliensis TaxID=1926277 RepID=UPI0009887D61|nr:DinB family protein [Sediminibacillus massiliensis]